MKPWFYLGFILLLFSCQESKRNHYTHQAPASNQVWTTLESGVAYSLVSIGQGDSILPGAGINTEYTVYDKTSKARLSSLDRSKGFHFTFGKGRSIPAWEETLQQIHKGGALYIKTPPGLGFTHEDSPELYNQEIIFFVEVLP